MTPTLEQLQLIGAAVVEWLTEERDGVLSWTPDVNGADFVDGMSSTIAEVGIEVRDES